MIDFLLDSANLPFTIALGMMVGIGLLEGVSTLMGAGLSNLLDAILPDFDLDVDVDADLDVDADIQSIGSASALSRILGWIHLGRMPVLILFVIFLFGFGISGLAVQYAIANAFGTMLPAPVASVPAVVGAVYWLRHLGGLMIRYLPGDETQAVSENSFVGRVAVITLGTAGHGNPAQAKLRDEYGQVHYVMVAPENEAAAFKTGEEVLLIGQKGSIFQVVANDTGISFDDLGTQ